MGVNKEETYKIFIEVEIMLSKNSLITHDPASAASAVRHYLRQQLRNNYGMNGMRFLTHSVHVEAEAISKKENVSE